EEFVSIRYLSPEAADVALEENDYNTIAGYFDDEDNEGDDNEDEYATDSESEILFRRSSETPSSKDSSSDTDDADSGSAHSQDSLQQQQLATANSDDAERLEATVASPEYIYVDTQYMPPMEQGDEDDPIVVGDTQYTPFGGGYSRDSGSIVIAETQMVDSNGAIDIPTSPPYPAQGRLMSPFLEFPLSSPELVASTQSQRREGESSARGRERKHRMSSAERDGGSVENGETANGKKRRGDEEPDDKDDASKATPPSLPSQVPPIRTRTQFKCAVCLDTPDPAVYVHPCGHVFCEGCAQGAVQTTGKCPVCRHAMRARSIRVLQFRVAPIGRTAK
ncbi:hypothetical protein GGI21_003031, partial [Coemansia aciculifera]